MNSAAISQPWYSIIRAPRARCSSVSGVNFGGDSGGGGDPYFLPVHEGDDPPLYQVYHDFGADAETILAKDLDTSRGGVTEKMQAMMSNRTATGSLVVTHKKGAMVHMEL